MKDDWPQCSVAGCDNTVNPMRVALGHDTCVELHGAVRKTYTVVPVPKSNGVVGTVDDLIGVSGSHKGSTMSAMVGSDDAQTVKSYARPPQRGRVFREAVDGAQRSTSGRGLHPLAQDLSDICGRRIALCQPKGGGYYWSESNLGLPEAYKIGLVTSRTVPARLTPLGELARVMILQGKTFTVAQLKKERVDV